jgi:hypothetical protein
MEPSTHEDAINEAIAGGGFHSSPLRKSPRFGDIAEALAQARGNFKPIKKDRTNPFFKSKYADLETVIAATAPALATQGVVVIQSPSTTERTVMVTTLLAHSSGEWLESDLTLPADQDNKFNAQTVGSAITYTRRYALLGMLNVSAEDDDDGNAAVGGGGTVKMPQRQQSAVSNQPPAKAGPPAGVPVPQKPVLTFAQRFWAAAKNSGKTEDAVRKYLAHEGYESTGEIPVKEQGRIMDWAEGK